MLFDLVSLRVTVRNFALLTYAVPSERVRRHLPAQYDLQTFSMAGGPELCFVSATCFCNQGFRWAASPYPRHTFNESTYRTYVSYKGADGVYFFGRYLGTALSVIPQRALARDTFSARFTITTDECERGYREYVCHASGPRGDTSFSLEADGRAPVIEPFSSGEEMSQFLTYRLRGYYTSSLGNQAQMPVSHARMDPFTGRLHAARLDLFDHLGILPPEEWDHPYSVLVQPVVEFRLHPPRPL